jgi:hypothetical protein
MKQLQETVYVQCDLVHTPGGDTLQTFMAAINDTEQAMLQRGATITQKLIKDDSVQWAFRVEGYAQDFVGQHGKDILACPGAISAAAPNVAFNNQTMKGWRDGGPQNATNNA